MCCQRIVGGSLRVTTVAAAVIATSAAGVRATGRAPEMRTLLGLQFTGLPSSGAEALAIVLHNAALCACPILGAVSTAIVPRTRGLVDVVLSSLLVANCAALGIAIGAYGPRVLRAHVALEFTAFFLAGGSYLAVRDGGHPRWAVTPVAVVCLGLLVIAAALETRLL